MQLAISVVISFMFCAVSYFCVCSNCLCSGDLCSSRQALLAQRHGDDHGRSGHAGPSLSNSLGSGPSDSLTHDNVDDDERVDVVGNDHRPDSVSPSLPRHHGK